MHIYTKFIAGYWHCYGTLSGYDYSFMGATVEEAQGKMIALMKNIGVNYLHCTWHEPFIPVKEPEIKLTRFDIGYRRPNLDNL